MQKITTFLMFDGVAEDAMKFYISLFDESKILSIDRYGANEMGPEGKVMKARFLLGEQEFCVQISMLNMNLHLLPQCHFT